jgi:hypothetical protein
MTPMATIYHPPTHDALALLDELRREHRQDLELAEARIALIFATSDKPDKPPMTSKGQRVLGKCKVHGLSDKAAGTADATIWIDAIAWSVRSANQNRALLHHELEHIAIWENERGDDGRPMLKSRNADFQFDGFHEIIERYGADACEASNVARVVARHQGVFAFDAEFEPSNTGPATAEAVAS